MVSYIFRDLPGELFLPATLVDGGRTPIHVLHLFNFIHLSFLSLHPPLLHQLCFSMKKCEKDPGSCISIYIYNTQTNILSIQPKICSVYPIIPFQPPKFLKSKDNVASDKMALDVSEPQLQTSTIRIIVDGKQLIQLEDLVHHPIETAIWFLIVDVGSVPGWYLFIWWWYCWWFRNPAITSWYGKYPIIYKVSKTSKQWLCGISEPSTAWVSELLGASQNQFNCTQKTSFVCQYGYLRTVEMWKCKSLRRRPGKNHIRLTIHSIVWFL